jgi:DNA polymerase III epsilon subunit-like protein
MTDKYPLACVDTETAGLKLTDDVLAISIRMLEPDGTPTSTEFYSLIHTDKKISAEAFNVNGITKEDLKDAPTKDQVIHSIEYWWKRHVYGLKLSPMGHNFIGFDKPRVELLLGDLYDKMFDYHMDDSMVIARALQRNGLLPVPSCSLKELVRFFKIEHEKAHNASADTYACGMVYSKLLKILNPSFMTRLKRVFNPGYLGVDHV